MNHKGTWQRGLLRSLIGAVMMSLCGNGMAGAQEWTLQLEWGGTGSDPGEFILPRDVAVDDEGLVYVTDYGNNRVQVFAETGEFLRQWGGGSGPSSLQHPLAIAVDGDFVYTLEAIRCRLQKWTRTGEFLDWWGECSGPGSIELSIGLAARGGVVYVAGVGGVLLFSENGDLLGEIGGGDVWFDVEVASDGTLWCSANELGIMRNYTTSGEILAEWSTLLPGETTTRPGGVTATSNGNVIVADWATPLYVGLFKEFRPDGTLVTLVEQNLRPFSTGMHAVGNDTVYAVSSGSDYVVKYTRVPVSVAPSSWGSIKATFGR